MAWRWVGWLAKKELPTFALGNEQDKVELWLHMTEGVDPNLVPPDVKFVVDQGIADQYQIGDKIIFYGTIMDITSIPDACTIRLDPANIEQ